MSASPATGPVVVGSYRVTTRAWSQRRKACCAAALVVGLLASSNICVLGKQKKKISRIVVGHVLDATDSPIAGASVELTDTQTRKKFAIYSEESGRYQFTDLNPAHDYEVHAFHKNISSDLRKVSSLDDRDKGQTHRGPSYEGRPSSQACDLTWRVWPHKFGHVLAGFAGSQAAGVARCPVSSRRTVSLHTHSFRQQNDPTVAPGGIPHVKPL